MSHRTVVLIHGFHPRNKRWGHVVWGTPENRVFGRLSQGLLVALEHEAQTVVIPGNHMRDTEVGSYDNQLAFAQKRIMEIREFADMGKGRSERWLHEHVVLGPVAKNTQDEAHIGLRHAYNHDCTRLILVSSPDHVQRCQRDVLALRELFPKPGNPVRIIGYASETSWNPYGAASVVVKESPPQ